MDLVSTLSTMNVFQSIGGEKRFCVQTTYDYHKYTVNRFIFVQNFRVKIFSYDLHKWLLY